MKKYNLLILILFTISLQLAADEPVLGSDLEADPSADYDASAIVAPTNANDEVVLEEDLGGGDGPVPPTNPVLTQKDDLSADHGPTDPHSENSSLFDFTCEEIKQSQDVTQRQVSCICGKETLEGHQRDIFNLKDNSTDKSLLELLKERDSIHAKLSITDSLLDIYRKYQGFLGDNDELIGKVTGENGSFTPSLRNLKAVKNFMSSNADRVSRYNLVSEVMSALQDSSELKSKQSKLEKIQYLQDKIRLTCQNRTHANSLSMCEGDAWESIQLEVSQTSPPTTSGDFLNKLVNTIINLDDWGDRNSIPSLFVDNDNLRNPTGLSQFNEDMTSMIDDALNTCRKEILISNENPSDNCMRPNPDKAQRIVRTLQALDPSIRINPQSATIGDLTQHYLNISRRSVAVHDEVSGGSVDEFMKVIKDVGNVSASTRTVNEALKGDRASAIRNRFRDFSKERLNAMASHLESLGTSENDKLFAKYSLDTEVSPGLPEKSNKLLQEILDLDGVDPFYKDQDGKLSLKPESIHFLIGKMAEKHSAIKDQQDQLQAQLKIANDAISRVKASEEYQRNNNLKDFLWHDVAQNCSGIDTESGQELVTSEARECQLNNNGQTSLTQLMKFNDEVIAYREIQDRKSAAADLTRHCQSGEGSGPAWEQACSTALREHAQNTRTAARIAHYANPANHNTIYRYDSEGRQISKYTPKSNLALFLPQAAYTFNEQLPFYFIQRPQMRWQVDAWRWAGKQQKTQQAYWNSLYQSWQNNSACGYFGCYTNTTLLESASPTFGNTGFNFGNSTTVPLNF